MQCWYSRIVAIGLGLAVPGVVPAMAQNEIVPTAKIVDVDWPEVAQGVLALSKELAAPPPGFTPKQLADVDRQLDRFTFANKDTLRPLAILNVLMDAIVPGVANVPIPVLAPIDTARYVSEFGAHAPGLAETGTGFLEPDHQQNAVPGKVDRLRHLLSLKPSLPRPLSDGNPSTHPSRRDRDIV